MPSLGLCAHLACIWEVSARKPGNVHRFADFSDAHFLDFAQSAAAIAPVMASAPGRAVGETILDAIRATRQVTRTNTNLGIVLLLAPLAAVPCRQDIRCGLRQILADLTVADAQHTYEAIRLAVPGGLGKVSDQDVTQEPTQTLRQVMALAADRDLVARQYTTEFAEILDEGLPTLLGYLHNGLSLEECIIGCHLQLLATYPDSLIARKRGLSEAQEVGSTARQVLAAGWPHSRQGRDSLREFDTWLRAEGHSRNPGTSADLVTACLFAALRDGKISVPLEIPWAH